MKKIVFTALVAAIMISCDNKEIKQTTDSIQSVRDGLKTLDSISAMVNDSAKVNRVIVPEIEKTKRQAEDAIRKNAKNLDSLAGTIDKVKNQIQRGSDIIKTVDSTNRELQKNGSIFDKITTVTGAISKVSKKNAKAAAKPKVQQDSVIARPETTQNYPPPAPTPAESRDPMVKTAKLKIYVDDISQSKAQLARDLRNFGGEIVTESFGEEEGRRREFITVKVPYRYFDGTLSSISSGYGSVASKSTETEGSEYVPDQMCDLEITFMENIAANDGMTQNPSGNEPKSKAEDAFQKGFSNFGDVVVWLLPFWPFLLIGLIIWFFVARSKRKKHEAEIHQMQQEIETMKAQKMQRENEAPHQNFQQSEKTNYRDPNDHSRFMPK